MVEKNNSWEMTFFNPILFCNTFSLHVISGDVTKLPFIVVVDIFGKVRNILDQSEIELLPFLNEPKGNSKDGSVELVASDSALPVGETKTSEFYLSTCWVVYDDHFIPKKYFAAFFNITIEKNKMIANLWQKFSISNAPTFCRLTKTSPIATDELYLLIFSYSIGAQAFSINSESKKIDLLENIGDVFPVFEIRTLPGAVTRSHCWITQDYRFSVVGFDTGYVVASVCTMHSGSIIDQRAIKFSGPISVLKLIETDEERLETCVLISSTLGPVVIWTLGLIDEYLQWKMKGELAESENYDSIISGNTNHEFIFIGTFFDHVLIYDLSFLKTLSTMKIPLISKIHVGSPILSINYVLADDTVVILSSKGFFRFVQKGKSTERTIKVEDVVDGELAEVREKPILDLNKFAPLD